MGDMFDPRRILQVLGRVLRVIAPLLTTILILSMGTELYARRIPWTDAPRVLEFWPVIVRDMLPSLAAMSIAYWLAARFVRSLYGLQKLRQGFSFLWRWRFGQMGFSPFLLIQEGHIFQGEDKVLTRAGGPGNMLIYNDSAVVLERAGRLTRVERSNFAFLGPFEKIYKVIDLRPKRQVYKVEAMTREGIPVTCEADISYQIRGGDQEPTERLPYPMLGKEVVKAATCTWKCEPRFSENEELDWEKLVILAYTDGLLRSILDRYPLDRLVGPAEWDEDEKHPRQVIREELERELRKSVPSLGARILSVNLGDIVVRDEVTEQWIAAWKTEWERWAMKRRAEGEAEYVFQVETAKAQAQVEMIIALTQACRSLAMGDAAISSRLVLLRFVTMLRHASLDPWIQAFLPSGIIRTLTALQQMIAGT